MEGMVLMNMDIGDNLQPNQCELCGKGPYRSHYYYQEHKKLFCKNNSNRVSNAAAVPPLSRESLLPTRAGKTTNMKRPSAQFSPNKFNPLVARKSIGASPHTLDESTIEEEEPPEMMEYIDQAIVCLKCDKEFDELDKFVFHRLRHINVNLKEKYREAMESQKKKFEDLEETVCEVCAAKLYGGKQMQPHLLLHLQNYKLRKNLRLEQIRRRQEYLDQDGEPEQVCPHCQAEFTSRTEYKKHVRSTCPRMFRCSGCERSYLNETALMRHKGQCLVSQQLQSGKLRSKNQCRNCALTFDDAHQHMWHEQSCPKVYSADLASRMDVRLIFKIYELYH